MKLLRTTLLLGLLTQFAVAEPEGEDCTCVSEPETLEDTTVERLVDSGDAGSVSSDTLSSSSLTSSSSSVIASSTSLSSSLLSSSSSSSSLPASTSASSSLATSSSSSSIVTITSSSSLTSSTATCSSYNTASTVLVDPSGCGQYTAINAAVSYAQAKAIPTVSVKAGTYNEAVSVIGSSVVTIIGETSASNDYTQNKVIISNSSVPMTISTDGVKQTTWRNINFSTTGSSAVSLRGTKNSFYNCQFLSTGAQAIYSTLGITFIANSYIEGTTQLFSGYLGMYVYNSKISATASSSGIIAYTKGSNGINSQVVFDRCSVVRKSGLTNSGVYIAAPNNNYSQIVYRSTYLDASIAAAGVHPYTPQYIDYYGEYNTTGAGSYSQNTVGRSTYEHLMTASDLTNFTIGNVFANSFTSFKTTDLTWIDSTVLASIYSDNSADLAIASSVSSSSSSSSISSSSTSSSLSSSTASSSLSSSALSSSSASSVSSVSSSAVSTSSASSAIASSAGNSTSSIASSVSSSLSSSSLSSSAAATSTSAGCVLPTTVPSTAKIVGPSGSCANYTNLQDAINALPSDSTTQYIYILAGTYTVASQVNITRTGATIFRGESNNVLDQSSNLVTISGASAILSSLGTAEPYSVFRTLNYNSKNNAFYNINFENKYPNANNYYAIAMDIKAQQVGFYSCGFRSTSGATFYMNYGTAYMSGCRIEGSQDMIWGIGEVMIYNSKVITNVGGYSIAAQSYQATYPGSKFIIDHSAVIPLSSSIAKGTTYLGRDYSAGSTVVYSNSFLDAHIASVGWSLPKGYTVSFTEANNTGPGASTASRPSTITILSDGSAYTAANMFTDASWIDTSAVAPFTGFPDSVYAVTSSSSSVLGATATSSSASSTSSVACPTDTVVVTTSPTDSCQYSNLTLAISSLANDGKEKTVVVYPGTYTGQIILTRSGKVNIVGNTTFKNDWTQNTVTVEYYSGVSTSAGQDEITPVINAKKSDLHIYNINFHNTYPQQSSTAALAADFYGSNMAFYGCSFIGFQDTLLLNKGVQVLSNCYIEGSVDFIWGYSVGFIKGSYIASNTPGSSITAHWGYAGTAGGFVIDNSLVTYTSSYGSSMGLTYLGRPWSSYARAIYTNSYLDSHINAAGWSVWSTSTPQTSNVNFYEYNNVGPGSDTSARASFSKVLTSAQAQNYTLSSWVGDTSWLDMDAYNLAPSYTWTNTSATVPSSTTSSATSSATASSTASATCGHPASGTVAPAGAVIVDASNSTTGSYSNLTLALASLPKDSSCQVLFLMPGTYNEQVTVNRPGKTVLIGYQTGSPGQTYTANQVTVSYARGLSVVAPIPSGHTDAETAVISTASTGIAFYNINFINTDNLDGATASYVTLAGSLYGTQIGLYGCSLVGWQDTLLTGATAGYIYVESSYIEGAIDFIWGYSATYFKGCTIAAKRKSSCITAHSRASTSAIGIYVFDECLVTAASGYESLGSVVYLGRPYSQYARVIYKYSYLDTIVNPSGWKIWSTTDPRTDHITFGEYQNTGPGNWESNAAARLAFGNATLLTSDTYDLSTVMGGSTSWIDSTYWNNITVPTSATAPTTPSTTTNTTTPATVANSTEPADGEYIVSQTDIPGKTVYHNLTSVIAAISTISSSKQVSVFIYPGEYDEQLTYNRSGTTIFRGYTENPDDYTANQVIIKNSAGVDTQGDQSNSDSATLYSRAKYLQLFNINLNNVFGTTHDYASLGFAIGNNGYAGFYGCQITGNQDTFDLNVGTSVFMYNSLVEGSIDFIWGAGSLYALSSTIVPNYATGSITADKRATNTSAGGMVFDQCTVSADPSVASGTVYLGRPYSQYAKVAWVESYLDASIHPAGWSVWSSSSPQTDGVLFGEYHNTGPGSSTTARASFSEQLSDADVAQFQLANFFSTQGTTWINMTYVKTTPFTAGVYTSSSTISYATTVYTTLPATATYTTPISTVFATTTAPYSVTTVVPASTITTIKSTTLKYTVSSVTSAEMSTKYSTIKTTVGGTSTVIPDEVTVTKSATTKVTVGSSVTVSPDPSTVTKYSTVKTTIGSSSTITPDPVTVLKTSTVKTTIGSVSTITPEPITTTKWSTVSTSVGTTLTVTPAESTIYKTSTVKSTSTVTSIYSAATSSVTSKITTVVTKTSTPATVLVTQTSTSTSTTTKFTTPKGVTTTKTVATVTVPGSTTTSTPKATTSWVTVYSTVSKSTKITTTLSCTPRAKVRRDDAEVNRFNIRQVLSPVLTVTSFSTVASTTVTGKPTTVTSTSLNTILVTSTPKAVTETDFSTITSTVTTKISTEKAITTTLLTTSTSVIDATTTLKASTTTTTLTSTSISSIDGTTTLKGTTTTLTETTTSTALIDGATTLKTSTVTSTFTTTSTSSIASTTTLKGSTVSTTATTTVVKSTDVTTTLPKSSTTVYSTLTSLATSTVKTTLPAQTVTISSYVTSTSVLTLPKVTSTTVTPKTATYTTVSTVPAVSLEVDKTATTTAPKVTVTAATPVTVKTTTIKTTTYSTSTVTSYKSGATTCAA